MCVGSLWESRIQAGAALRRLTAAAEGGRVCGEETRSRWGSSLRERDRERERAREKEKNEKRKIVKLARVTRHDHLAPF